MISPKPQGCKQYLARGLKFREVATKQKSDSMSSVKTTADSKDPDPPISSSDDDGISGSSLKLSQIYSSMIYDLTRCAFCGRPNINVFESTLMPGVTA